MRPYAWVWTDGTPMDILPMYYASPSANCTRGVDCLWNHANKAYRYDKRAYRDEPNNIQGLCLFMYSLPVLHTTA